MVEGVRQHLHLAAVALDVVDAGVQVAGVHLCGDRRHPSQRAREAAADQQRGEQRAGEREEAGEDEGARNPVLGTRHARQWLPHTDGYALGGMRARAGDAHLAIEQAKVADVGQDKRREPVARGEQPARGPVLLFLHSHALAIVGCVAAEQLGRVGGGAGAGDKRVQNGGAGVEGLAGDVRACGAQHGVGRACAGGTQRVRELTGVPGDRAVDLAAQLGAGAVVHGEESDPGGDDHHECHPHREPPAQAPRHQIQPALLVSRHGRGGSRPRARCGSARGIGSRPPRAACGASSRCTRPRCWWRGRAGSPTPRSGSARA